MIKVTNLEFDIGEKNILSEINIKLERGKINAIIGQNGSGKTTLLKLLSGDYKASGGSVFYGNHNIKSLNTSDLARRRSVLEQIMSSGFPFTGKQILELCPFPFTHKEFDKVVAEFTLEPLLYKNISTMSGGEFQRLHAARVYLQAFTCSTEGHCIFLDEPTSALDLGYEIRVIDSFQKLAKEKNYIICGITNPSSGSVFIDGYDISRNFREIGRAHV